MSYALALSQQLTQGLCFAKLQKMQACFVATLFAMLELIHRSACCSSQDILFLQLQHSMQILFLKLLGHWGAGEETNSLQTMRYRRLDTDFVSTDPFTGLYLAAFGSHGPEVLQLRREPDSVDVNTTAQLFYLDMLCPLLMYPRQ